MKIRTKGKPFNKPLSNGLLLTTLVLLFTQCQVSDSEEILATNEEILSTATTDFDMSSTSQLSGCDECDFIVNSYSTDGEQLGIKPGDVICLDAAVQYSKIVFRNIVGTRNEPVIIRNCGGVATVHSNSGFGIKFENSKDYKLIGDGSADQYGIKVTTGKGFYITMEMFSTDFEIARVEVAGLHPNGIGDRAGFAGIGVKTSPYQDCDLFTDPTRQAWIMRDVVIRDNYIHDTGGEGIYLGHGFYTGRKESKCPSVTYSHSIRNVKIYNNLIENVGYDGMQIKNANQNVKVYNNVIRNYGTKNHSAHNEGLFIGEGTTGKFYNNIIDTGTGNGCQIQGIGNLDIYNNVFLKSGEYGIYGCHGAFVKRISNGYFNILNNTIIEAEKAGFVFYNEDGGPKRFINNVVSMSETLIKNGATLEEHHNILSNDLLGIGFNLNNLLGGNCKPEINFIGVDQGADLRAYGIYEDIENKPRPSGLAFDIGAYEQ
ncbi:MAG: right-handed parallel beta-helix repeat-containing protein [Marinoscillum sp.]